MKVICFDASGAPELIEGNPYTAKQCDHYPDSYVLKEMQFDPADGELVSYRKVRFIPTSQKDEMELLEQRQKELVAQ